MKLDDILNIIGIIVGATISISGINAVAVLSAFALDLLTIQVTVYSLDYIKNINVAQANFNRI